jgi:N12 class adenine-specific DNA methylase
LDERGSVDLATVGRLLGCEPAEARQRLGTLVYDDPEGGPPQPAATYLSGDVRQRLAVAKAAAGEDDRWLINVSALEAVQPRDLEPAEIDARLGASWIEPADVKAFCAEVLRADVSVEYAPATGEWAMRAESSTWTVALTSEWGTERANGVRLVEANANQRVVTITDEGPDGSRVTNLAETLAAREKQEAIAEKFSRWVWEDPERSARLSAEYNRRFNSTVLPDLRRVPPEPAGVDDGL